VPDFDAEARIDQALIARVLGNDDQNAFGELVRRHQGMVRAQLHSLMPGDHASADDIAQETFLIAWKKLHQFRGDARFSTWLYRIAYSCFLQSLRKRRTTYESEADESREGPSSPSQALDLKIDIDRAMQQLSAGEQRVLLHCVQLGLSHEEAAYVLAMPLGTVKTHATRGKAKLRELLANWHHNMQERRKP
jgi:RNA polymerase sigma factor (sigma-70 family)